MLTDTHCHLDFDGFADDRAEVIQRAMSAGLGRILNPGIDSVSSFQAVRLSEVWEPVFAAVGVHPNSTANWDPQAVDDLRVLSTHQKVVAIGEIGLDYYRDRSPRKKQIAALETQLALAAELELPVVLHNREAARDLIPIMRSWHSELRDRKHPLAERPGVFHSFSGTLEEAQRILEAQFLLGFTGPVTFRNARALQALVIEIPLEKILIETDAPFLSPHPYRGQRNEPARVVLIAEQLAALHHRPLEEVVDQTGVNAKHLFRW